MADLEESIFQRNVPGRYSKWDREEGVEGKEEYDPTDVEREINEENECEEMQLLRCAEQLSKADVPEPIRQRILAERATKSATGVKGVLADYKAAQALALAEAQVDALARQEIITRMVEGVTVKSTAEQIFEEQVLAADGDSSEGDLSDDEADDAFMREFRAKRLKELKQTSSVQPVKAPIFGEVREIRADEFLVEIEQVDPVVTVVVHLYEPAVQGCVRMNGMLDELAATMPHLKFLRMQASSNEIEVDRVALPILTLYRAGETVCTLAGIVADFGQYFTLQDVTWFPARLLEVVITEHSVDYLAYLQDSHLS